jgi:hypothetical protein
MYEAGTLGNQGLQPCESTILTSKLLTMKHDFILRIYNHTRNHTLADINNITVSDITLISKPHKQGICMHNGNRKKFGYKLELSKKFFDWAGSHSYPILAFKGEYIDIIVKDFPRYPCFAQDKYEARNIMNGWKSFSNNGFPECLLHRKVEILPI